MAAEKGILMRSGGAFEVFKDIKKVVLDKTGTITKGKPQVIKVFPLSGYDEKDVLQWGASAENVSEHPLVSRCLSNW